jgi:hypothetical protein
LLAALSGAFKYSNIINDRGFQGKKSRSNDGKAQHLAMVDRSEHVLYILFCLGLTPGKLKNFSLYNLYVRNYPVIYYQMTV